MDGSAVLAARQGRWPGVRWSRISSVRAFPEGLEWAWRRDGDDRGTDDRGRRERHRMPLYEHVYLARQDVTAQRVDELTAQYKGVIEQMGGKVSKTEYWGVKSLS